MKRFTETLKWEDVWFRKLKPETKLLWQWLLDKCDNAGVIEIDLELASFQIGYQYPMDTLLEFGDRLVFLECGKHFIPKFISFQYGKISTECKAHNPIFQSLEKHNLKGYPKGIHTLLDRVQDKEKEKDKEKVQDKGEVPGEDFCGLPDCLNTETFRSAWTEYVAYRRESKISKLKPKSVVSQWGEMAGWGESVAIAAIAETIRQGWQGIFEPKAGSKSQTATARKERQSQGEYAMRPEDMPKITVFK